MSSEDVVDERAQDRGPVHCAGSVLSRACVLQPAAGLRDRNIVSPPPRPRRPKLYFSPDSLLRAASKFFIAVMDREEPSGCEKTEVAPGKSSRKSSTADPPFPASDTLQFKARACAGGGSCTARGRERSRAKRSSCSLPQTQWRCGLRKTRAAAWVGYRLATASEQRENKIPAGQEV